MSRTDSSSIETFEFNSVPLSEQHGVKILVARNLVSHYTELIAELSLLPIDFGLIGNDADLNHTIIAFKPDIVIFDDQLLEKENEVYELLTQHCFLSHYPAIIYVCTQTIESTQGCYRMGCEYLQAPLSSRHLMQRLKYHVYVVGLLKNMAQELSVLRQEKRLTEEETLLVGRYIDNVCQVNTRGHKNFRETIMPLANLSGDLILTALNPRSEQLFLLADFTGHGLPAAVGSIVVSGIFHSMVTKGFSENDLVKEINDKLKLFYPTGRYMAGCFLKINHSNKTIEILNCGMPDVLFYSSNEHRVYEYKSTSLPLGIVKNTELELQWAIHSIASKDRLIAYTDGLIDSRNRLSESFGKHRVITAMQSKPPDDDFTDVILENFSHFTAGNQLLDDVGLLEVFLDQEFLKSEANKSQKSKRSMEWCVTLDVNTSMLKQEVNPVTLFLQYICELQGLEQHRDTLYTILSELYLNALEHGILGLDSVIKEQIEGFSVYYQTKQEKLKKLTEGHVTIQIENKALTQQGELIITVHDTGCGFDPKKMEKRQRNDVLQSGRGIDLVKSLSHSLEYFDHGRKAVAIYTW